MRIHHFTLLALCVLLPLSLMLGSRVLSSRRVTDDMERASTQVREAVKSSAALLSMDGDDADTRNAIVENIFMSLYASRGALTEPGLRAEINRQLPIIVVTVKGVPYVSVYGSPSKESTGLSGSRTSQGFGESPKDGPVKPEGRYWTAGQSSDREVASEFIYDCLLKALGPAASESREYRVNLCEELGSTIVRARTSDSVLAVYRDASRDLGDGERLILSEAHFQSTGRSLLEIWESAEGRTYHRHGCSCTEGDGPIGVCYSRKECAGLGAYPCEKCFGEYGGRENV